MQNDPADVNDAAEKAAAKEAKRKKRARLFNIIAFPIALIMICGWETVCLKNIPLLVAFLLCAGGFYLIPVQYGFEKLNIKRWSKIRQLLFIFFVFLPCIFAWFFLFISVMNFLPVTAISEKTTYLTEPRTPDGKMLDIPGAIARRFLPDCPPEDNGFREVVQAFGFRQVMANVPEDQRDDIARRLFAALNIDDAADWDAPPRVAFESVDDFFMKHLPEETPEETPDEMTAGDPEKERRHAVWEAVRNLYYLPLPEEHRDLVAQWLAENNAALDQFGEAVRRPEYFVPFFQDIHRYVFLEEFDQYDDFHREMASGLHLRVLDSLEQGDFDRAKQDLLTVARLAGQRMRHPRTITNLFSAATFQGIARNATLEMLQHGHANHEQLATLWEELTPHQHVFSQADALFLMRMQGMGLLYHIGTGEILASLGNSSLETRIQQLAAGSFRYVGWTPVFQKFNTRINELEKIAEMPLSPEQLTLLDVGNPFKRKEDWLGVGKGIGDFLKYMFAKGIVQGGPDTIGNILTNLGADSGATLFSYSTYRQATMTRLLEIAFALEHYALDHDGTYPESLDALVAAGHLAVLPTDPCTDGEPFRYRLREVEGRPGYLLYGIGINMQDDNGVEGTKTDPETGDEHRGDDMVIEMPAVRD